MQEQNARGSLAAYAVDLEMVERKDVPDWKTFELAATASSDARGTSGTFYALEPVQFLRSAMEAAKRAMVIQPLLRQEIMPTGNSQYVIPKQTIQIANGTWTASAAEYSTADTSIVPTTMSNFDGVTFEPNDEHYAIFLTNYMLRRNALNEIENAQRNLNYRLSYRIDAAAVTATTPATSNSPIVEMTNSVKGCQTIFGDDATDAASSLAAGSVMTPTVIRKALRLLASINGYYWTGNVFTKSAVEKNPWKNTPDGRYYGIIAPEDLEALQGSSQFTNAAQFGDDSVVKNGQVAKYLGCTFAVSDMMPYYAASANIVVQAANTTEAVPAHEARFVKANYWAGLVWGQKPKFYAYDFPNQFQKRLSLEMAYQCKPLYDDAVVRAILSDA